ncbi:MAG: hypothetical protein KGQ41_00640 [Alphaproteobacteria bacterium]|nr:hypothetical protein [Alphaproteobacteria bacterium]
MDSKPFDICMHFRAASAQVHVVDPKIAGSYELLEQAYNEMLVTTFPEEAPYETLEKWHRRLEAADAPSRYIIGISGEHLDNPKKRKLMGLFVGIYYKKADAGVLAYNIVKPQWQGSGLGAAQVEMRRKLMLEAARQEGKKLGGIFAECNDPALMPSSEDVMDPRKRIEMYAKMGGLRVPIKYSLQLGPDPADKSDKMMLIAFPHPATEEYPQYRCIAEFIRGIYEVRGFDPEKHPDFHRMERQLRRGFHKGRQSTEGWLIPLVNKQGRYDRHRFIL